MTTVNNQPELNTRDENTNLTFGSNFDITGSWTPKNINAGVTINGNYRVITINIALFPELFFISLYIELNDNC